MVIIMLRVFTFDKNEMCTKEVHMWKQHLEDVFQGDEIVIFPKQLGRIEYNYHNYLILKGWVEAAERKLKEMEVWYEDKSEPEEIPADGK